MSSTSSSPSVSSSLSSSSSSSSGPDAASLLASSLPRLWLIDPPMRPSTPEELPLPWPSRMLLRLAERISSRSKRRRSMVSLRTSCSGEGGSQWNGKSRRETMTHVLLLLVVERILSATSNGQVVLEFVDGALQKLSIPLKLLDLLAMRMRRFLGSSIFLWVERGSASFARSLHRRTHPPRLGDQIPQLLGLLALRSVVALHPFVRVATSLKRLGELGDVALERADLCEVLLLGAAKLLLLATLDE